MPRHERADNAEDGEEREELSADRRSEQLRSVHSLEFWRARDPDGIVARENDVTKFGLARVPLRKVHPANPAGTPRQIPFHHRRSSRCLTPLGALAHSTALARRPRVTLVTRCQSFLAGNATASPAAQSSAHVFQRQLGRRPPARRSRTGRRRSRLWARRAARRRDLASRGRRRRRRRRRPAAAAAVGVPLGEVRYCPVVLGVLQVLVLDPHDARLGAREQLEPVVGRARPRAACARARRAPIGGQKLTSLLRSFVVGSPAASSCISAGSSAERTLALSKCAGWREPRGEEAGKWRAWGCGRRQAGAAPRRRRRGGACAEGAAGRSSSSASSRLSWWRRSLADEEGLLIFSNAARAVWGLGLRLETDTVVASRALGTMKDGIPETFRFTCRGDTREPRSQNRFEAQLERSDGTVVYSARCDLSTAMDPHALETTLTEDYLHACAADGARRTRSPSRARRGRCSPSAARCSARQGDGRVAARARRAPRRRPRVARRAARSTRRTRASARASMRARGARGGARRCAARTDELTGVPEADRRRATATRRRAVAATLTPRRRAARRVARAPARAAGVGRALPRRRHARRAPRAGDRRRRAAAAAADAPPWDEGADPEEVRELDLLLRRMCAKDGAWEHADPVSIAAKRDRLLVALVDRAWREG